MVDLLDTARAAGAAVAMATNAAILLTDPDRYALWVDHVGAEVARVRVVDALSRLSGWLRRLSGALGGPGHAWSALEDPVAAMLRAVVAWDGSPPLPAPLSSAAEAALPLFGVNAATGTFDPAEAPTLPLLRGTLDPLAALADEALLDERSELRLVVRRIVQRARLSDALLAFRSGEVVLLASDEAAASEPTAPALDVADTTPRVADVLERTDLCLYLGDGDGHAAIRLSGSRLLLAAWAPTREPLEVLRDVALGPMLDLMLQGLEDRTERVSAPPWGPESALPVRPIR